MTESQRQKSLIMGNLLLQSQSNCFFFFSQQVYVVVFSVGIFSLKTSLQIQDSNNADVLLDSVNYLTL